MTQSEQVGILTQIEADRRALRVMAAAFDAYVSESPISGDREQTILLDYAAALQAMNDLYQEILTAVCTWLLKQP
jgi:hypothetical protein